MPRRKTTAEFVEELRALTDGEYEVFGEYVNNREKMRFRHNRCGREYWTTPHLMLTCFTRNGGGCLTCGFERNRVARRKSPDEFESEFHEIFGAEYDLLDRYVNNRIKVTVRHVTCGNTYKATPNNLIDKRSRCGFCMRSSRGELAIRRYLADRGVPFSEQYRFDDCRSTNTLPFDFAVFESSGDLALLIEFDGEQHFAVNEFFGGEEGFAKRKLNDSIKTRYCRENGIKLLRIPHWDIDNIPDILSAELNANKGIPSQAC